jgi:folylpolyglutamate synthase/dihydropteroate synthase
MITTKDYKTVLKLLLNAFDKSTFIFTDGTDKNKFFKGQILYDYAQSLHTSNHLEYSDFAEGIKKLNSTINFIVGSFYVYDKAKELLK